MSISPSPSINKDDLTKVADQPTTNYTQNRTGNMSAESLSAHEVVKQKIRDEKERETKLGGVGREVDESDVIAEGEET